MLKRALVLIGFFIPVFAHPAIYKCEGDGPTIYSDQPCGNDAKRIQIKAPARMGSGSEVGGRGQKFLDSPDQKKELAVIDEDIERLRRKKARAKMRLDNALTQYQRQKASANSNSAGAAWEDSLAQETEVLRNRYQAEINEASRQIEQLRAKRQQVLQGD